MYGASLSDVTQHYYICTHEWHRAGFRGRDLKSGRPEYEESQVQFHLLTCLLLEWNIHSGCSNTRGFATNK
jgi:hypothetical protein